MKVLKVDTTFFSPRLTKADVLQVSSQLISAVTNINISAYLLVLFTLAYTLCLAHMRKMKLLHSDLSTSSPQNAKTVKEDPVAIKAAARKCSCVHQRSINTGF